MQTIASLVLGIFLISLLMGIGWAIEELYVPYWLQKVIYGSGIIYLILSVL